MLARSQNNDPVNLVHAVNAGLTFATVMAILAAVSSFARGSDFPKSPQAEKHKIEQRLRDIEPPTAD
jgi:hypothetical protein